jgi:hypothetical protein
MYVAPLRLLASNLWTLLNDLHHIHMFREVLDTRVYRQKIAGRKANLRIDAG